MKSNKILVCPIVFHRHMAKNGQLGTTFCSVKPIVLVRWQFAVGTEALREEPPPVLCPPQSHMVKVKVQFVPVHVMKVYRGAEVELHSFNISTRWR